MSFPWFGWRERSRLFPKFPRLFLPVDLRKEPQAGLGVGYSRQEFPELGTFQNLWNRWILWEFHELGASHDLRCWRILWEFPEFGTSWDGDLLQLPDQPRTDQDGIWCLQDEILSFQGGFCSSRMGSGVSRMGFGVSRMGFGPQVGIWFLRMGFGVSRMEFVHPGWDLVPPSWVWSFEDRIWSPGWNFFLPEWNLSLQDGFGASRMNLVPPK